MVAVLGSVVAVGEAADWQLLASPRAGGCGETDWQ